MSDPEQLPECNVKSFLALHQADSNPKKLSMGRFLEELIEGCFTTVYMTYMQAQGDARVFLMIHTLT